MKEPPLGWTTIVKPIRVIDGDTIEVEIAKRITVRITDDLATFNTPEISHAKTKEEKEKGLEAKAFLEKLINEPQNEGTMVLHVPQKTGGDIQDIFTLGRVVGRLFLNNDDVTDIMTKKGFNVTLKKK